MSNKALEQTIREKIKVAEGKPFQQLFWDIMILRYADLQTPRMQHDLGNDGYSISGRIFFACNAPESIKYDNKKTAEKISDDYQKFCDKWKTKYPFKKWIFVTKDNLMGGPHQRLIELNNENDSIKKENWGLEQIIREALCLDDTELIRIFNLPDSYLQNAITEKKDFGIIAEIFEFIFANKIQAVNLDRIKKSDNYTKLKEKISLNFSDDELRTVKEMLIHNWERKALVEKYLKDESGRNQGRVDALIDKVQSDFRRIKNTDYHEVRIESVRIIESMAREYVSKNKQSNPDYIAGARAVILYFFELCYLGKKAKQKNKNNKDIF